MTTIAERLREAMKIRELRQADVVERSGVNKGALSSYISGRYQPKQDNIYRLAKALNVNEAWLMGADVPMDIVALSPPRPSRGKGVRIPVLGRVAAGIPIEAIEEILDWEEIPEEVARTGEFFGLRVKGDSMTPDIKNADTLIIRKQEDAESGEIVIATVNGSDAVCKKLYKSNTGITLYSLNAAYEPMQFSALEIRETPVSIIGKVEEIRRKL